MCIRDSNRRVLRPVVGSARASRVRPGLLAACGRALAACDGEARARFPLGGRTPFGLAGAPAGARGARA
eukprot:5157389-Prymnesium_polylepis.1